MTDLGGPEVPDLESYGWGPRWEAQLALAREDFPTAEPGRVVRQDRGLVTVAMADGSTQMPVRRTAGEVTVGDWVAVEPEPVVVAVLGRSSLLRRQAPDGSEQLLAANVDVVTIVAGLDRPVKSGRLQRAVTLAWDAGAVPLVVLTKTDIVDDPGPMLEELEADNPGVNALAVCAPRGVELARLLDHIGGRTSVLLGESGAGKSTLLNALLGSEVAATGEVRGSDSRGRHTTTSRNLHLLPGGGAVIDTPGIRSVGLWADSDAVAATFSDIEELGEGCRFSDCRHGPEPGCAVRGAVDEGTLAAERLASWEAMQSEAEAAMLRADEHARRQQGKRFARVVKDVQRLKGGPGT